jgi:hypothetical protein
MNQRFTQPIPLRPLLAAAAPVFDWGYVDFAGRNTPQGHYACSSSTVVRCRPGVLQNRAMPFG